MRGNSDLDVGWVHPWVGLGLSLPCMSRVGLGWVGWDRMGCIGLRRQSVILFGEVNSKRRKNNRLDFLAECYSYAQVLESCDFIGDRYSYTRVDVNIVLTADFSWSYIAFLGWVGSVCTLPWVGLG